MTTHAWSGALTEFESRLERQEAAVADGALDDFAEQFVPPDDLPPLPAHLRDRAEALVWRCRALEERIADALARARTQLDTLEAAPPATAPAQPVFFDSRL